MIGFLAMWVGAWWAGTCIDRYVDMGVFIEGWENL